MHLQSPSEDSVSTPLPNCSAWLWCTGSVDHDAAGLSQQCSVPCGTNAVRGLKHKGCLGRLWRLGDLCAHVWGLGGEVGARAGGQGGGLTAI